MVVTTSHRPQQGAPTSPSVQPGHPAGPQWHQSGPVPRQQWYGAPAAAVPPQWTPPAGTGPQPNLWGAVPVPAPRNGLGIAALCLGIVGLLFGLVPFTGFIAFALGAVGVILGLVGFGRARRRSATNLKTSVAGTALSAIAIALGVWGMVIVFTGLNQLSEDLSALSAPPAPVTASGTGATPTDVSTPYTVGPASYRLEITGDAKKMMVGYGTDSATSSSSDYQTLPWSKTVEVSGEYGFAHVNASSFGPGSITCTITEVATGQVVDTKTSTSLDDSEYSSANVDCDTMG